MKIYIPLFITFSTLVIAVSTRFITVPTLSVALPTLVFSTFGSSRSQLLLLSTSI